MVIARSGGHPFVRADDITVDIRADVDKIRLKYRAAKVRADDAEIRIRESIILDVRDIDDFALIGIVLVPGAVIRFIDCNMAILVVAAAAIDQNVALLRLGIGNSRPAGGEIIIPIIHAIAAGRRLAEVRVVSFDQRHTLAAANGLPVQASDPVDRIIGRFAVGRGKGRRRQQTDDQDHGKYKTEYTFFHTSSSFYQIYLFTDAPSHRYTFSVRSIYSQIYLVKKF